LIFSLKKFFFKIFHFDRVFFQKNRINRWLGLWEFFHDWLQGVKKHWRVCPAAFLFLSFHEDPLKSHEVIPLISKYKFKIILFLNGSRSG